MPVVINEFEVVSEPPQRPEPGVPPAPTQSSIPEQRRAAAAVRALVHHQERLVRVRAH